MFLLKGNSRRILTNFCIDVYIEGINFTEIVYVDDDRFYEKSSQNLPITFAILSFYRGS